MKNDHTTPLYLRLLLAILFPLVLCPYTKAQVLDSGEILRAGSEDANLLLKEYLRPFGGGFGADLNSGWFTSAKPLKKFGFDFRISASASLVPVNDRHFDVTQLNLKTVQLLRGPARTPTAFGDDTQTSTLGTIVDQEEVFSFEMPAGVDFHFVPAPMAQFSLGLPESSQITFRFTPRITINDDYRVNLYGFGGMIGLNPLLFDNRLPIDLSLQAGIMKLSADGDFEVLPKEDPDVENTYPDSHWDNQLVLFDTNTFALNILAGKKYSVLSLFGGIGYQYASTKINTSGSFPVVIPKTEGPENGYEDEIQSVDDPINFTLDGANTYHILAGFQVKVSVISLSAAYTLANYSTFRAGIGIMLDS